MKIIAYCRTARTRTIKLIIGLCPIWLLLWDVLSGEVPLVVGWWELWGYVLAVLDRKLLVLKKVELLDLRMLNYWNCIVNYLIFASC